MVSGRSILRRSTIPEGTTPQAQIEETTPEDTTSQAQIGHKARHGGLEISLVPGEDVGQVQEKAVGSSVATVCDERPSSDTTRTPSPIDDRSSPKRMTHPPDRYGEWEFNDVMSSELPPVLGMKFRSFRRVIQARKDQVLCLKEDCMRKVTHLKNKGEQWKGKKTVEHWC